MDKIKTWPKAHIAGETLLAQPAREAADTKDHNETDHTLSEFWKSTAVLRNVLDQGRSLSDPQLCLLETISTSYR